MISIVLSRYRKSGILMLKMNIDFTLVENLKINSDIYIIIYDDLF